MDIMEGSYRGETSDVCRSTLRHIECIVFRRFFLVFVFSPSLTLEVWHCKIQEVVLLHILCDTQDPFGNLGCWSLERGGGADISLGWVLNVFTPGSLRFWFCLYGHLQE